MKGTPTVREERWFNWTSSRQTRDELKAAANKLIWSSVINSSVPILINRIPVALPQSHTERSCSHTVILSHVLCISLSMSSIPHSSHFPCHVPLFHFYLSLILSLSFFIFITSSAALTDCVLQFLSIFPPSVSPSVHRESFPGSSADDTHSYSLLKAPYVLYRLKLWRKRQKQKNKLNWKPSDFVMMYIDTKKVYMYEKVRGSKNSLL